MSTYIYSSKSRFLINLSVAVAHEEAGVEAMMEETGSSDVDGGGGDRWSR
jgi:hypothetical protein